ncbi:MAG: hypothetical protein IJ841_11945 [Prevotella sp.]|nr:hypothetical protein [Prevotella sp.]
MKRLPILSLLVLLAAVAGFAQTAKSPEGLYHLLKFIYQDGSSQVPSYSQYKYAADSVGLLISYRPSPTINQWSGLTVEIRESYPLTYTGEKPQGPDGHGTQIFNVDDHQFSFKWYNDRWANMGHLREFITEVYVKELEPDVALAFLMFENKTAGKKLKAGKFSGWWVRTGAAAHPDGSGKRQPLPVRWKAYGPGLSMVADVVNNGNVLQCFTTNTVKYENDTTLYEIGHRCDICWLSDDCHTLTFVQENGQPLTEVWVRSGLPQTWQNVFRTDLPLYRDGNECIRLAVDAATKGNMQQAESYIDQAINEKEVNIEALCMGTMGIAIELLVNKQQYKACKDFCERQLQNIKNYVENGHDHDASSRLNVYTTEAVRAVATYRSGEKEYGKKLIEDRVSFVEAEIEKYRSIRSMDGYINALYFCNLLAYHLGYDILGTERTLLYLDALALIAPAIAAQQKTVMLSCRAKCYLLDGDNEGARKLWQQIKDTDANYMKNQPADDPLKKAFGE